MTVSYLRITAAVFLAHFALNWVNAFLGAFSHRPRWRIFFEYLFAAIAICVCIS